MQIHFVRDALRWATLWQMKNEMNAKEIININHNLNLLLVILETRVEEAKGKGFEKMFSNPDEVRSQWRNDLAEAQKAKDFFFKSFVLCK